MSTTATAIPEAPDRPPPTDTPSAHRVTLPRVIRSEWIKLRSVRSSVVTLAFAGVAVAAFGVLVSLLGNGAAIGADGAVVYDPAGNSLFGTNVAQLVLGVLGALLFTTEYSTGLIRATFTAVPRRVPVLWAKVVVLAAGTFATMVVSVAVAFFVGQAVYGGGGSGASFFDPGVPGALLGAAVLPTAIAVLGLAFGALARHTATAVGVLVGILFIVPMLLGSLGGTWADLVSYLPSEAGQAMATVVDDPDKLSPFAGFLVLAGWVGAFLAAAAVALKRRDA